MRDINKKTPLIIIFISTILTLGIVEMVTVSQSENITTSVNSTVTTLGLKNNITELYNKVVSLERAIQGYNISMHEDYKESGLSIISDIDKIIQEVHTNIGILSARGQYSSSVVTEELLYSQIANISSNRGNIFLGKDTPTQDTIIPQLDTIKSYCLTLLKEFDTDLITQISVVGHQSNNVKISAIISTGVGASLAMFLLWIVICQKNIHSTNKEQLESLLYFDQLTNLPNRRMVFDENENSRIFPDHPTYLATCLIDIDRFSNTNDTIGHYNGDDILVQLVQRMGTCHPQIVAVARFGGDEFVVVYNTKKTDYIDAVTDAEGFGTDFLTKLTEPFSITNMPFDQYNLSLSMGVSVAKSGQESADVRRRIKEADIALYHAKSTNKGSFNIFAQSMETHLQHQITAEHNVRKAVSDNKIKFNYQPIVNHNNIIGAESLLSWADEDTNKVYNHNDLMSMTERLRLSTQVGYTNLDVICRQLRHWIDTDVVEHDFVVSINVGGMQVKDPNFVHSIENATHKYKIPYSMIRLEITDSVMFNDIDDTFFQLRSMKDLGVTITIDDFGSGFTSLAHIKHLPVTDIKICKSFTHDVHLSRKSLLLLKSIKNMCDAIGVGAIIDGVENTTQLRALEDIGFDTFQGQLFGGPVNSTTFADRYFSTNTEENA